MNAEVVSSRPKSPTLALTADDFVSIISARRWYFVLPAVVGTLLSFIIAGVLPPQYKATAVISVESQQIPEDLIRSTITSNAAERIDYITQRVLTRKRILETARSLGVYAGRDLSESQTVDLFRSDTSIQLVNAGIGRGRSAQSLSFSVSFDSDSPDIAQLVANELVTMYLDENVRTRSERAAQTTEFLAEEGEKIRLQINDLELKIAQFKKENSTTMPELMSMNLALMSRYESELQSAMLTLEELVAERKVLELQREQYIGISSGRVSGLGELQRQYADVLVRHTPQHPDAVYLAREIAKLRSENSSSDKTTPVEEQVLLSDPAYARIITQLAAVERKANYMLESRRELRLKLVEQETRIAKAPIVEQEFVDLQRDLANLETKYQDLKNKEIEAKISQNLEEDQKGERFNLLEAAIRPIDPEKPNRLLILIGGMALSLAIGMASMAIRELLNPGIRSIQTVERLLGVAPLLTVPEFGSKSALSAIVSWKSLAVASIIAALVTIMVFQVALSNEGFSHLNEYLSK